VVPPPGHAPGKQWDFRERSERDAIAASVGLGGRKGGPFGMWCNHALFHPYLFEIVPSARGQLVTALRRPVDRFVSAWRYVERGGRCCCCCCCY